jgi:hypothetical protein
MILGTLSAAFITTVPAQAQTPSVDGAYSHRGQSHNPDPVIRRPTWSDSIWDEQKKKGA